ncbi:MAG: molybdenum cofactor guanylyltransferase [Planctomycetes bacterium]|nr:molybdenum cofactor guanylyltransferase [Planctomycetota bacterium]
MLISAAILAGGQASRLNGLPKGTLQVDRHITIIDRQIHQCRKAGMHEVIIVANRSEPYKSFGVSIIGDNRTNAGPMAGIEAALAHYQDLAEAVLFVPCDLPFISAREFKTLEKSFLASRAQAVYAMTHGSVWHPLCAIAQCDLLTPVSHALTQGERKIRTIWRDVNAQAVPFTQDNAFFNVNTHADIARMRAQLGSA